MPAVATSHTTAASPLEVLVVDDVKTLADALVLLLQGERINASAVYSGAEAVARCASYLPDLVLLDFMMPEMDGGEVASRLQSIPAARRPKIVIHTALDLANPRLRDVQCDRLLHKTYQADQLVDVLFEVAGRR
jgi:CheY-like chemotaxis protein